MRRKNLTGFVLVVIWLGVGVGLSFAESGVAEIRGTAENSLVSGKVLFQDTSEGLKVTAQVQNVSPGKHGFHIHEFGDCSSPDAMSAGGHFNPKHMPHGAPGSSQHHAGDLGNITADAAGKVHYELVSHSLSFKGAGSILGRSMVVHADQDDLHSQPVGNAGARLACGVIGVAKQ